MPVTVIVNVGPPVGTIEGLIVVIVGITPMPDSGTSILVVAELENVSSSVAVSRPAVDGGNVMPRAHEMKGARLNVGGAAAHAVVPFVGATRAKSAELVEDRMLMLATMRAGFPDPTFTSVPSITGLVAPFGTLPKFTGLGKHPAPVQKFPIEVKNSGMGPFTIPVIGISSGVSSLLSLTVSVAVRVPGGVPRGGLKVMLK